MANCTIHYYSGSHAEIGFKIGKTVQGRLGGIIDEYLQIINTLNKIDFNRFHDEGTMWFNKLPGEYQEELSAMADGSGCRLEKIILWCFCDNFFLNGCTSFICKIDNVPWIGRNNDYACPNKWNFINIIAVNDKIPVLLFGLEEGIFSGTGYSREKIWLHYNWLPSWDKPSLGEPSISPYVFIRQALETCSSICELENILNSSVRDNGMTLFVVDGKTNEYAVYECTCNDFLKRKSKSDFISAANHHNEFSYPEEFTYTDENSIKRQKRVEYLLSKKFEKDVFDQFISILSDSMVEQNEINSGTVYSALACPSSNRIWYAADGFSSASNGGWEEIKWKW